MLIECDLTNKKMPSRRRYVDQYLAVIHISMKLKQCDWSNALVIKCPYKVKRRCVQKTIQKIYCCCWCLRCCSMSTTLFVCLILHMIWPLPYNTISTARNIACHIFPIYTILSQAFVLSYLKVKKRTN